MGKCVQIEIPEEINESKITSMWISLNKTASKSLTVENAKVYFRDPNANHQQQSPPFKIKDNVYIASKSMKYDLRSRVKINLADDPRTHVSYPYAWKWSFHSGQNGMTISFRPE